MSILRKIRRSMSPGQKAVDKFTAVHLSARCEGFKVSWCDKNDNWHSRLFNDTEGHRAAGWYQAKVKVCPFVAIYERKGQAFELIQAGGVTGEIGR